MYGNTDDKLKPVIMRYVDVLGHVAKFEQKVVKVATVAPLKLYYAENASKMQKSSRKSGLVGRAYENRPNAGQTRS